MSLIAKDSGGGFDTIAEGVYHAVCIGVYDLGTQCYEYNSKQIESHKVVITWELPDETIEIDGEDMPRNISKEYTHTLNKKADLCKHLEPWRGKKFTEKELEGFNIEKLLTANCQLSIVHTFKKKDARKENPWADVGGIMALPKGTKKISPINGTTVYKIEDGRNIPDKTPNFIKNKIMDSKEYKSAELGGMGEKGETEDIEDSEIPF